jgi:hypothetical protein
MNKLPQLKPNPTKLESDLGRSVDVYLRTAQRDGIFSGRYYYNTDKWWAVGCIGFFPTSQVIEWWPTFEEGTGTNPNEIELLDCGDTEGGTCD